MAFFNRKKSKDNQEVETNQESTDLGIDFENDAGDRTTNNTLMGNFNELHDSLEQEIIEAIGQGSEDVKNITVVLDDDDKNELKFTIAAGKIKNIDSSISNFDIDNRLKWVDERLYNQEELENVSDILAEHDFFDALTHIVDNNPENGEKLAEIVADTYLERSYKALVYGKELKVSHIRTDWSLDSDSEVIEAYTISIDPEEIENIVEDINNRTNDALDKLINRDDTVIYVNNNTDYEELEKDIERYIVGAALSMYENGVNQGVVLETLMEFSDGFSVPEVIETVIALEEEQVISFTDPFAPIEHVVDEEEEVDEESDTEDSEEDESAYSDIDDEEEEYYPVDVEPTPIEHNYDDIINEPFPHTETGTPHLGGALTQYIQRLIDRGVLPEVVVDRIEYANQYNTLYEQSIQGIERAIDPAVKELNRSVDVYQQLSSLNDKNEVNTSSNLHTAVYSLESERNDLNNARYNLLTELYHAINDNEDIDYELKELMTDLIILKIEGIEQVKNTVYGSSSQYVPESEFNLNEETVPMYYTILQELGIEEN